MAKTTAKNSAQMVSEGVEWEIAFFDFVDSFRKSTDKEKMIIDVPLPTCDARYDSLLKSMVLYLCDESEMEPPEWAEEDGWLKKPWFVCGLSRLHSYALVETPIWFRKNNIFVLSNFMQRI